MLCGEDTAMAVAEVLARLKQWLAVFARLWGR